MLLQTALILFTASCRSDWSQ